MKNKLLYIVLLILFVLAAYYFGKNQQNKTSNSNPIPTDNSGLCTRTTPYDTPPELTRALSLVTERWSAPSNAPTPEGSMLNCIHLIYKDHSEMNDAEGFFSFDKNSDPNDIRIYIDDTYKGYDDILTASLLKHEVIHAIIYYMTLEGTPPPSCVENEVDAFYSQLVFLTSLNPEEWKSITYRVTQNPHLNSAYELTYYLLLLNGRSQSKCGQDDNCWKSYVMDDLRNWIKSNPYYQKQCSL